LKKTKNHRGGDLVHESLVSEISANHGESDNGRDSKIKESVRGLEDCGPRMD